jgi:hypothetical protein
MALDDQSLPLGSIMTLGYYYGIPGTNAEEHSCGGSYSYLSCLPRVPTGADSLWAKHSKTVYPTHVERLKWGLGCQQPMLPQGRFHVHYLVSMRVYRTPNGQQGYHPPPPSEFLRPWKLAKGFIHYGTCHLSHGVRRRAEGCVAPGWLLAGVTNDPLGVPGSTPLYLSLLPVWGSAGGDYYFSITRGTIMNGTNSKTGRQNLKLERGPFPKGSLQEILQQGAGSSGTSVRCLDATSEPVGETQVKDRDVPMVRDPSETQLTTNPLGSTDTVVPLRGASTSSIPAEGGSGQTVSGAGGFRPARKALSGAARRKLKEAKA